MHRDLIALVLESAISAELLLFAVFLLSNQKRTAALFLLAGLSLSFATMIAGNLLIATLGLLWLADIVLFFDLLAPAIFYLYVRRMHFPVSQIKVGDLIHIAPAVFGLTLWKLGLLPSMDAYVIACWMLYMTAAVFFFVRDYAAYEPVTLRRFIILLMIVFGVTIALRVVMAYQAAANISFYEGLPYLIVLAATFLVSSQLLFTSLRYPNMLCAAGSYVKYAQSGIDTADLNALGKNFVDLIRDRKPYLNPNITLSELSQMLGVRTRLLSQLVNARYGMNVSAYMNQCRVREAAKLLGEAPEKPIKVVMFEAGFTSKSIFNREFLRQIGVSPSAFRLAKLTSRTPSASSKVLDDISHLD